MRKLPIVLLAALLLALLSGCSTPPETALLTLEAAQDGLFYAVEIDGEFVGKLLYAIGLEADYVERYVTVGEHTLTVTAYNAPGDYFADAVPAFGPKELTLEVPAGGISYMFSQFFFYPLP